MLKDTQEYKRYFFNWSLYLYHRLLVDNQPSKAPVVMTKSNQGWMQVSKKFPLHQRGLKFLCSLNKQIRKY